MRGFSLLGEIIIESAVLNLVTLLKIEPVTIFSNGYISKEYIYS